MTPHAQNKEKLDSTKNGTDKLALMVDDEINHSSCGRNKNTDCGNCMGNVPVNVFKNSMHLFLVTIIVNYKIKLQCVMISHKGHNANTNHEP